ncbi:MAG: TraI domain-containing protein [Legionellaceae bacterium]
MFHQPKKIGARIKPLAALTAITPVDQLLDTPKRSALLQIIRETSGLNLKVFNHLCMPLIKQMLHYCQKLPESSHQYYSLPGGLFDYALNRTEAAVVLFRHHLLPDPKAPLTDEQKLWWYTLFSASFLRGIGKLSLDYLIELYDQHGTLINTWDPLQKSLSDSTTHYTYTLETEHDRALRSRLNLLLARQIMPKEGFEWIASCKEALHAWLFLLDEDHEKMDALSALLDRADALAIQRDLIGGLGDQLDARIKQASFNTFIDKPNEPLIKKEQAVGLEFIEWLHQKLERGGIILNQAPLYCVPAGILIGVEAFKLFVREHPEYKNWQAIQQGLVSLGLHHSGEHGSPISRLKEGNGIVLKSSIALPDQLFVQDKITQHKKRTNTLALLLEGMSIQWATTQAHANKLSPKSPGAPNG